MKIKMKKSNIIELIPGTLVCIAIALFSKYLALFVPSLGAATLSIFLGIFIGNTFGNKVIFHKGTKFCEGTLLAVSIVLLGGTLSIRTLMEIGWQGVLFIVLQMITTITGVILIGKRMGFNLDFIYLMASGNAVCGSSAIASTAPVIKAHSREKGIAITMVNVTGTVLMIMLPAFTSFFYGNELFRTSAFLGGILQSVGQVVAGASMINDEVKDLATIFKIVRIIFLVGVVFLLASLKERAVERGLKDVEEEMHSNTHQSTIKVPLYIIGFFIFCILYSIGILPQYISSIFKQLSNWIEIIALAGIGMRVYSPDLMKQGVKTSVYCGYIAVLQVVSAVIWIWILL